MEASKDSLKVQCSLEQDCCFVKIEGEINSVNMSVFQEEMETALMGKKSHVVIDFSDITYISSAGLRVLLKCSKDISNANRKLAFFGLNEFVADVFKVSGLDKIFNIQADKEKAFQAVLNS